MPWLFTRKKKERKKYKPYYGAEADGMVAVVGGRDWGIREAVRRVRFWV